jgi:predicted RND superfamily exporter protein
VLGIYGTTLIQREGKIVNDIPHDHDLFTSLMLMENDMGGVMPLEILVDTRQPRKAKSFGTIRKLSQLSDSLRRFPELAKPMSIADAAHFAKQGFYNGDKEYYGMPSMQEMSFISKYLPKESNASKDLMGKYIDSTQQITRMSIQMKDVGAIRMHTLADSIWTVIREVFPAEKYDITLTGFTMLYARGADYLVQSMFVSLALAIVLIAGLMAMMFSEWRMVLISLIPNVIPLLMTGALMGFFHVPIKPSTVLVFSIAFGISVDNTIHFLAKYRQELLVYNGAIRQSVISAIRETGVSMLYTSIILFSGFSVFAISDFGGTIALGLLVSFTLFSALFSNLLILPSLLLTLEKIITTKAFSENN